MRLSSNYSPIAASERNADKANSGETHMIQKTAGFPTLKVTTESSRSENQNNKQKAVIITDKHKGSKTKVREKLDKSSEKPHRLYGRQPRGMDTEPLAKASENRKTRKNKSMKLSTFLLRRDPCLKSMNLSPG